MEVIRRMLIVQQQRIVDLFPRCLHSLENRLRAQRADAETKKKFYDRYPECVLADCVWCPRGRDLFVIYSDVDLVCSDGRMAFGLSCRH